jgi:hypothetical protein
MADCAWRISKFRTPARSSNAKSGRVFFSSLLLGFLIVGKKRINHYPQNFRSHLIFDRSQRNGRQSSDYALYGGAL